MHKRLQIESKEFGDSNSKFFASIISTFFEQNIKDPSAIIPLNIPF
jgi:hypothetical protein